MGRLFQELKTDFKLTILWSIAGLGLLVLLLETSAPWLMNWPDSFQLPLTSWVGDALGDGLSLPWPKNLGDTLALLSGITWAFGTLGLYKAGQTGVTSQIMAFLEGAFAVTFFAALLMSDAIFTQADATWGIALLGSAPLLGLFTIPMTWRTV